MAGQQETQTTHDREPIEEEKEREERERRDHEDKEKKEERRQEGGSLPTAKDKSSDGLYRSEDNTRSEQPPDNSAQSHEEL